jgi:hypothetical protein
MHAAVRVEVMRQISAQTFACLAGEPGSIELIEYTTRVLHRGKAVLA